MSEEFLALVILLGPLAYVVRRIWRGLRGPAACRRLPKRGPDLKRCPDYDAGEPDPAEHAVPELSADKLFVDHVRPEGESVAASADAKGHPEQKEKYYTDQGPGTGRRR